MRRYETNGEYLTQYLRDHHLGGQESRHWRGVGEALLATARAEEWIEALREMASLQLARRLVKAGSVLLSRHGLDAADREIKQMIVDTMVLHYTAAGDVYERLMPAVSSSLRRVSNPTRKELASYSRREMPFCYLCGVEMDFASDDHLAFTIDHVWPQAYGGDSDLDNLLGACRSCNGYKADTPSWAMYPIQSLVAGFQISDTEDLPKSIRFAVQARTASMVAREEAMSLRDAYIHLGRPSALAVKDLSTSVDVFNLEYTAI